VDTLLNYQQFVVYVQYKLINYILLHTTVITRIQVLAGVTT